MIIEPATRRETETRPAGPRLGRALCSAVVLFCLAAPAAALIELDFEQPFFVQPDEEIWDFALVEADSVYHVFYTHRVENTPGARSLDLGHATSPDLIHWSTHAPALAVGTDPWENWEVWAPHVVRDTADARWVMAYTGVDSLKVQRPCLAYSTDLFDWTKEAANPVWEPDTLAYHWSPTMAWSSYRDPYLYREDGEWHMLSTAGLRLGDYPGYRRGIVHHLAGPDLLTWEDRGVFFENDGDVKWHDLESPFYVRRDGLHHLFFTEYDVSGVSHVAADSVAGLSFATRRILDDSAAPEILPSRGRDVIGRYTTYQHPIGGHFSFVLRFDALDWSAPAEPEIFKDDPWAERWDSVEGTATLGNPAFGDNPVERGEEPSGPAGNFSFGSREYWRGPLSGVGAPGAQLGDFAQGSAVSRVYVLEGDRIDLLVGGGRYPETCYVALLDADTDSVLFRETGLDQALMTPRVWDVRGLAGRSVVVAIVDAETDTLGYISVDGIRESYAPTAVTPEPPPAVRAVAVPNPFNPRTEFRFSLAASAAARLDVFDARGRRRWTSGPLHLQAGARAVPWNGDDGEGRPLPSGAYLFRLMLDGRPAATGRLVLSR